MKLKLTKYLIEKCESKNWKTWLMIFYTTMAQHKNKKRKRRGNNKGLKKFMKIFRCQRLSLMHSIYNNIYQKFHSDPLSIFLCSGPRKHVFVATATTKNLMNVFSIFSTFLGTKKYKIVPLCVRMDGSLTKPFNLKWLCHKVHEPL